VSAGGIKVDSRALEKALGELAGEVAAMPETWAAVGDELLPAVRQRTPVRTGDLRDSWDAAGEPGKATISSDLPYAGVIESREHPVADAIDASERVVVDVLEREVAKAARSIGFEVRS
jgi:hypothetical protein